MAHRLIIRSGGQSGVDRAALDVASRLGLPYDGWCPKGGWAEDYLVPPGLRSLYPKLAETPSSDPRQRTAWNVRDSDATLILAPDLNLDVSPGTVFTRLCADVLFTRPWRIGDINSRAPSTEVAAWLAALLRECGGRQFNLNVAGPRESEVPGVQGRAAEYLLHLLRSRK